MHQHTPVTDQDGHVLEALTGLAPSRNPEEVARDGLHLITRRLEARVGWLALLDDDTGEAVAWSTGLGFDGEAPVSHSVIASTLKKGTTQRIASVLGHPQYQHTKSGTDFRITSVLCAPVGRRARGVLYLQDRSRGFFDEASERAFETFARTLDTWVDRVAERAAPHTLVMSALAENGASTPGDVPWLHPVPPEHLVSWTDAKNAFRKHYLTWALAAHDGNKTATARALELARARLFSLVKELDIPSPGDGAET